MPFLSTGTTSGDAGNTGGETIRSSLGLIKFETPLTE